MISEYGADTVVGFHQNPSRLFSEDFQVDYILSHFEVFDNLFEKGYFIGEHYWNFQDFMTKADYTRVLGLKKIN
jgi:beta-glucuronidase